MNISQMSGIPWHVESLKKDDNDDKRHKSRCVYYKNKKCLSIKSPNYALKCGGSSHCSNYRESIPDSEKKSLSKNRISITNHKKEKGINNTGIRKIANIRKGNKECVYNFGKKGRGCMVKAHPGCDWTKDCKDFAKKEIRLNGEIFNANPRNLVLNDIVFSKQSSTLI